MSELLWNVCVGHSINLCSQWFKRIIRQERQSDAAAGGFLPLCFSMSLLLPLCLLLTASISLPPISNFLRIIRPSSEPGQWKTLLQIAPFTSRFSSQKTSSTSNLQVSKKSDGCQLRAVSKGMRLSYVEVTTVMWSLQDTGKNWMTPYKNNFPDPIWEGIARCVNEIVLSLIMHIKV